MTDTPISLDEEDDTMSTRPKTRTGTRPTTAKPKPNAIDRALKEVDRGVAKLIAGLGSDAHGDFERVLLGLMRLGTGAVGHLATAMRRAGEDLRRGAGI